MWLSKVEVFSGFYSLANELGPCLVAVHVHADSLMQCVAKILSMVYPWQVFTIQLDRCRVLDIVSSSTKAHTLGLGQLWDIPLTLGQHFLQHLPVGGQQDQVISISTCSIPQSSDVTA